MAVKQGLSSDVLGCLADLEKHLEKRRLRICTERKSEVGGHQSRGLMGTYGSCTYLPRALQRMLQVESLKSPKEGDEASAWSRIVRNVSSGTKNLKASSKYSCAQRVIVLNLL